jgi:hypothetical protein
MSTDQEIKESNRAFLWDGCVPESIFVPAFLRLDSFSSPHLRESCPSVVQSSKFQNQKAADFL